MRFTYFLDEKQEKKFLDWDKEQVKKNDGLPAGCMGGRNTWMITQTTLGTIVKVINNISKDEIDLTDYGDW